MQEAPESGTIFLSTKLAPPQVGKRWVSRTRLNARLGVPPHTRLCLVHAGAGFGKTACLSQWYKALSAADIPVAWLSLNGEESNLPLFVAHLAAAINRVCPEIGTDVIDLTARRARSVKPDAFRTALINAIASPGTPLVLIVDDYHLTETPEINAWVGEFIALAPANFHLVLASRSLPTMRIARLRTSNEVSEIDAQELALSFVEVRDFIKLVSDSEVMSQDIANAHAQTEGWVGGLQMIAIAFRNQRGAGKTLSKTLANFGGDARNVSTYLRDEVLVYLPPELSDFLLCISILERFCPELCAAVSERSDAAELLEQAVTRELFVLPLDDKGHWYRYHQLFADFLQAELNANQAPRIADLHQRACTWFSSQELWSEAVHHAILSADQPRAIAIAERCAMDMMSNGDYLALQSMLVRLPADQRSHGALLRLTVAFMHAVNGKPDEVKILLSEIATDVGPDAYADEQLAIQAVLAYALDDSDRLAQALDGWSGQMRSNYTWVGDVLKTLSTTDLIWRGRFAGARDFSPCTTTFTRVLQRTRFGWSWLCEAKMAEAEHEWLEALDLADGELGARSLAAMIPRVPLARLAYERGEFDAVEMLLATRIDMLEQIGSTDFLNQGFYALGWSRYASGDRGSAIELHERLRLMAMERGMVRLETHTTIELMRICWRTQPDRVAHLAQRLHAIVIAAPTGKVRSTRWLAARLAALGVAFHHALNSVATDGLSGLDAVVHDIVDVARGAHTLNPWLLLLIAAHQAGEPKLTRKALMGALRDGQTYGLVRSLVDTGEWVAPLVLDLQKSGAAESAGLDPGYLAGLLASFAPAKSIAAAAVAPNAVALVEPLSPREQDILVLVARGLSNKLIARTLNIGPGTVKWHMANLLGKLGAANRLQAVNKAQALSLLSPAG